jgi:hypothetical protein
LSKTPNNAIAHLLRESQNRCRFEVEVALDGQSERPSDAFKLTERGISEFIAVRPERGAAEAEEEKITVWLAPRFENKEGVAATGVEEFDDGEWVRDVFLRVEGRENRFDIFRGKFHFVTSVMKKVRAVQAGQERDISARGDDGQPGRASTWSRARGPMSAGRNEASPLDMRNLLILLGGKVLGSDGERRRLVPRF